MNKVIITVRGKDSVGIIAKVCTHLAAERINVRTSSRSRSIIVLVSSTSGIFNMALPP